MRSYHHRAAACVLLGLTILVGLIPLPASAVPATTVAAPAPKTVTVETAQPTPSIAPDDTLRLNVTITTENPVEYLEVRVRLRSPSGKLVYQKTEVRTGLTAGSYVISYEHDTADLDLKQGRYPFDLRVRASDVDPITVNGRVLVVDPETDPLRVAVIVVPSATPYVTMAGTFAGDPSADTGLRDDLAFLAQLAIDGGTPLAIALPPVLTEQLARVAAGYETTAGVTVAASDDTPTRYARMLDSLRSAIETGTVELLDVPYGLPDLADLGAIGGSADIDLHWRQTDTVNALARLTTSESDIVYLGEHLSAEGLASADDRGATCVLAHEGSLRSEDTTAGPGFYTVDGTDATVVVVDDAAAAGACEGAEQFYDALFARLGGGPVVVVLQTGTDAPHGTLDVHHALTWLDEADWLKASDIASLASPEDAGRATIAKRPGPADVDYWSEVAQGRSAALAYAQAVGPDDADAAAAVRAVLTAESSLAAAGEPDSVGTRQGLARAAEALEYATAQFALVRLDAKDVTLSGTKGDVPLTLINDTGKQLTLTLHAASGTRLSTVGSQEIVAGPAQNFLTLPVDLGNALSDDITLSVRAGDVTIAEATVGVRASYIDRLATILMVVVVLAVLLVIIRRKVGSSVADTIQEDSHGTRRASRKK